MPTYFTFVENMTDNYPSLTHRKAKEWTEWVNRIETTDFCK